MEHQNLVYFWKGALIFLVLLIVAIALHQCYMSEGADSNYMKSNYTKIAELSLTEEDPLQVRSWYENYLSILSCYPRWRLIIPLAFFLSLVATFNTYLFYFYGPSAIVEAGVLNFLFTYALLQGYLSYHSWHIIRPSASGGYKKNMPCN